MALRYRQEYNETGDVLDPQAYNVNQNELISEFNGGLDRQNILRQVIQRAQIVDGAFNAVRETSASGFLTADMTSRTWQTVISEGFAAPVDCLCIFEYSGYHTWPGVYSGNNRLEDAVQYRITLDGTELFTSHFYGESVLQDAVYLPCAVPVPAGQHTVSVEILFSRVYQSSLQFSEEAVAAGLFAVANPTLITTERRR